MDLPGLSTAILGPLGVVALLLAILVAYTLGWWHTGAAVKQMIVDYAARIASAEAERDRMAQEMRWWRDVAMRGLGVAEDIEQGGER